MKSNLAIPSAVLAAVLALALVVEWLPSAAPAPPKPAPAPHAHAAAAAGDQDNASRDTGDWADVITSRPLFAIGRRPPKLGARSHTVAATGLPRLSGIMITQAGRRAIFMPEGGKPMTLAEGASLDDYTLRTIAADRVVLTSAKGDMVLRPSYDSTHAAGTVAAPFQAPSFQPPVFQPPGFNPGFNNGPVGFPPGQPPPGMAPPPNSANDDAADNPVVTPPPNMPPQQPFPGIRGPFIPRGRTQ